MHTSVVELRPENILDLAKDVIRPTGLYCEWNVSSLQKPVQCRIALNSWNAYLKHLERHCREGKEGKKYGHSCRLPRCNVPSGVPMSSINHLMTHIQQSHLSRSQLHCPIRECASISFSRPGLLDIHFRDTHADLIGREVPLSSPILLPTWRPFKPDYLQAPAPPHRRVTEPGTALLQPVRGTPFRASKPTRQATPALSQSSAVSPRKKRQLEPASSLESVLPPPSTAGSKYVFADLPCDKNVETMRIVRRGDHVPDVSRPQDILDPAVYGYRLPPGSILYPNFVRIHKLQATEETEEEAPADADAKAGVI